ncbi:hypothetical protein [Peribacillus butanolivorans]|uniref:hypothetical protein n=1 Tax=Peribacillus butanolivorans TaxID=421767 RepID=UPI00366D1A0D
MSEERKVRYGDVEDAISKIGSTSEAFETSLLKEMASGNELDKNWIVWHKTSN